MIASGSVFVDVSFAAASLPFRLRVNRIKLDGSGGVEDVVSTAQHQLHQLPQERNSSALRTAGDGYYLSVP